MVNVCTPHGTGGGEQPSAPENRQDNPRTARPLEHYSCGLISLLFVGVLTVAFYPLLISITMPLGIFATMALVSMAAFVWSVGWIGAELLWEWCTGRWLPIRL